MPTNSTSTCSFCQKSFSSHHLHRHIVKTHTELLLTFNSAKTYDNRNIKKFDPEKYPKKRSECVNLDLPDGEMFYYCFGCETGIKKKKFADKHKDCMTRHGERMQGVWEQYKHLLDGSAAPDKTSGSEETNFDFTGLQRLIWSLIKQDYVSRSQIDVNERHLEAIDQRLEQGDSLTTQEEFQDLEPVGSMGVYLKEIPWGLYGKTFPFEKDLPSLIKKFEKPENQELWMNRIK